MLHRAWIQVGERDGEQEEVRDVRNISQEQLLISPED